MACATIYSQPERKEPLQEIEGFCDSLQVEVSQKIPLHIQALKVVGVALLALGCICLALTAKEILFLAVYKAPVETALIETLGASTIFCFWIGKSLMDGHFPEVTIGANLGPLNVQMK